MSDKAPHSTLALASLGAFCFHKYAASRNASDSHTQVDSEASFRANCYNTGTTTEQSRRVWSQCEQGAEGDAANGDAHGYLGCMLTFTVGFLVSLVVT